VDYHVVKRACVLLQYSFQVRAKRFNVCRVIRGVPQYLDLLKQSAAISKHRKREILVDVHLVINDSRFVRLTDADD
jgi:hypothetical protein